MAPSTPSGPRRNSWVEPDESFAGQEQETETIQNRPSAALDDGNQDRQGEGHIEEKEEEVANAGGAGDTASAVTAFTREPSDGESDAVPQPSIPPKAGYTSTAAREGATGPPLADARTNRKGILGPQASFNTRVRRVHDQTIVSTLLAKTRPTSENGGATHPPSDEPSAGGMWRTPSTVRLQEESTFDQGLSGKDWQVGDSQPEDKPGFEHSRLGSDISSNDKGKGSIGGSFGGSRRAGDTMDSGLHTNRVQAHQRMSWRAQASYAWKVHQRNLAQVRKRAFWQRVVLMYDDKVLEERFEAAWAQPNRLVYPISIYSIVWSLTYVQHKTIDSWFSNKMQIGLALMVLCIPAATIAGCFHPRTLPILSRHFHSAISLNTLAPTLTTLAVSVYDQLTLPQDFLCPSKFYACPHHAMDAASVGIFLSTIAFLNMLSPCMAKYKLQLNILIFVLWNVGALSFNTSADSPWLSAFMAANIFMVSVGTFVVGYNGESVYRQSVIVNASVFESRQAIESILKSMIPFRLLGKPIQPPLVEHFERVTVMFCSFDKTAVSLYESAEDFYGDLQELYARFDDIVGRSGLFKLEHVGEDYVVTSPNIYFDTQETHQAAQCRVAAAATLYVACKLVKTGNSWTSKRTGKRGCDVFKFKAGVHCGQVTAGILGRSRKFYRLFGDSVVLAARLCQASASGAVRVSPQLDAMMGDVVPSRKKAEVVFLKGKGNLPTYVLDAVEAVSERRRQKEDPYRALIKVEEPQILDTRPPPIPSAEGESTWCGMFKRARKGVSTVESQYAEALETTFNDRSRTAESTDFGDKGVDTGLVTGGSAQSWMDHHLGPVSSWLGCFEERGSEAKYNESTLNTLRRSVLQYLWVSRLLGFLAFTSVTALGRNEGWDLEWGEAQWETDKVTIPVWMGMVQGGILVLSLLLDLPARSHSEHVVTWWRLHTIVAVQNTLFGLASAIAIVCVSSIFTVSLPVAFLSQLACARLDVRLALGTSVPFVAAAVVEAYLTRKLVVIWAQLTFIAMLLGVLVLVLWHSVHSEVTRRKLWASRQHAVEWRSHMSRLLCDMLPKQYAQELVISTVKLKHSKAVASGAVTQEGCILFSDLVGFTAMSEKLAPNDLTDIMHHLWCCFDALVQKYGMHKIDTVGDAFIVVGLVKEGQLDQVANDMVNLAKWMVVTLQDVSMVAGHPLGIRIGIDTGPIVTGIIGTLQRRFHAHGQVVSNAQSLEGGCPRGGVFVSQAIASCCPEFRFTPHSYAKSATSPTLPASPAASAAAARGRRMSTLKLGSGVPPDLSVVKEGDEDGDNTPASSHSVAAEGKITESTTPVAGKNKVLRKWAAAKHVISASNFLAGDQTLVSKEQEDLEALFASPNKQQKGRRGAGDGPASPEKQEVGDLLKEESKSGFDDEAQDLLRGLESNNATKLTGAERVKVVPLYVDSTPAPESPGDPKGAAGWAPTRPS